MIQWASNVNQRILRIGSSWGDSVGFIADSTRSGKQKRRISPSIAKRTFSVSMRFSYTEYQNFRNWYENATLNGLLSFAFPKIDGFNGETAEYQFTENGSPKYTNNAGQLIEVSMEWEEV